MTSRKKQNTTKRDKSLKVNAIKIMRKYKVCLFLALTLLSVSILSVSIIKIGKFTLVENLTINFTPKIDDTSKTEKIEIGGNNINSDLIFQTTLTRENFHLNPDVVLTFHMDVPGHLDILRYNSIFVHEKGTIEIWMRPEWYGDDQTEHYFADIGENSIRNRVTLYKDDDDYLKFRIIDKQGKEYVVKKYVGNKTISNEVGLNWKPGEWYSLASSWDMNIGELNLFVNKALVDQKRYGKIPFDCTLSTIALLGNGIEIKEDPNWRQANVSDDRKCGFILDEFIVWKNKRQITQLLTEQFVSQYTSQIIDLNKKMKFLSLYIEKNNPSGTSILVHTRSSVDGKKWSDWSHACEVDGKYILLNLDGRYFQIEIDLTRDNTEKEILFENLKNIRLSIKNT